MAMTEVSDKVKAIIQIEVPPWQVGQQVSVYFPDSMYIKATCEAEQELMEPRVLTLDEVMKLRHRDEIWIEYGGAHNKLFMLTVAKRRRWGFTFYRHFPCYWDNYGGQNNTSHDWWWRCWSGRPTEEQRETTAWTSLTDSPEGIDKGGVP